MTVRIQFYWNFIGIIRGFKTYTCCHGLAAGEVHSRGRYNEDIYDDSLNSIGTHMLRFFLVRDTHEFQRGSTVLE